MEEPKKDKKEDHEPDNFWLNYFITNLVAYFQGKRLLGNREHHFRDLCKVRALSGSGGI